MVNPHIQSIAEGSHEHTKVVALLQECGRLWEMKVSPIPGTLGRTKTSDNPRPADYDYFLQVELRTVDQINTFLTAQNGAPYIAARIYIDLSDADKVRLTARNVTAHCDDEAFTATGDKVVIDNSNFLVDIEVGTEYVYAVIDCDFDADLVYYHRFGRVKSARSRYNFN